MRYTSVEYEPASTNQLACIIPMCVTRVNGGLWNPTPLR